jgi:hypothetical protein
MGDAATGTRVTNYALTAQPVLGHRYILNFRVARFSVCGLYTTKRVA